VLDIRNVSKRYYNIVALKDVSFIVPEGSVMGVLGPNGAGKSTLFKLIAGILYPDSGKILPMGGKWPSIGYKPETIHLPNRLKVSDYLKTTAGLSGFTGTQAKREVANVLEQVNLLNKADNKIGDLSKGMRQRVGMAQAILGNPQLLLLDEPSSGLDPEGQIVMREHIRALSASGKTILLNSHQLEEVKDVCTHVIIMDRGQVRYENNMAVALADKNKLFIRVDRDLLPIKDEIESIHPGIQVEGSEVVIAPDAIPMRRHILTILLSNHYDVVKVGERGATLQEIYHQAFV